MIQKCADIDEPAWLRDNMTPEQYPSYLMTQVARKTIAARRALLAKTDDAVRLANEDLEKAGDEIRIVLAAIARRAGMGDAVI